MGMFVQAGKPFSFFGGAVYNSIINYDPTIVPNTTLAYQSKIFPSIGYHIFRNNYATDDEVYLLSHAPQGRFIGHRHYDVGSFSLFAFNTPLMLDSGSGAYDDVDVPYFKSTPVHNVVSFTDLQGNNVNGLDGGSITNASSVLRSQYDFWSANIGGGLGSNHYQRSMALLKSFDNTIIVFDVVKTALKSQANFNVFSNRTALSNMGFYTRSLSQCYNSIDLQMDHLLNFDNIQITKNRLGDCPSNWPKNLSDAAWSRYQQNVSSSSNAYGDTNYLTIIRPTKSGNATHTIYQTASSNPQIKIYKVLDKSTNNYFVLIANVSKENTVATTNFPALVALKNVANDAVLSPVSGTISVQLDYGTFLILMPEIPPTTNTGLSLAANDLTTPVLSAADSSANQESVRVGINTVNVHESSIFEVSSSNKGLLLPRVTKQEMQDIASPALGLTVYCTSCVPQNIYCYDGNKWKAASGFSIPVSTSNPVITVSPTNYTAGTSVTLSAATGQWKYAQSFTYQWKRNGVNITGSTSSSFTTTANGTEKFECQVTATNNLGAATALSNNIMSSNQIPTVLQIPIISNNGLTYFISTPPSFGNGNGTISYQWLYNSTPIAGATSFQFVADASYLSGMVQLACSITNNAGTQTVLSNTLSINFLLDNLTTAPSAAYSLRKLRLGYTGSAINVRRSSDNTTQDIGFTTDGKLNTDALLAFVGSGNGFVTKWYDQSGNLNDATQTTNANQPLIVNAGVVTKTSNGTPALFVNTQGQSMKLGSLTLSGITSFSCQFVVQPIGTHSASSGQFIFGTSGVTSGTPTRFQGSTGPVSSPGGMFGSSARSSAIASSATVSSATPAIFSYNLSSTNSVISYANGISGTSASSFTTGFDTSPLYILGLGNYSRAMIGYMGELIYFNNEISNSNRKILEKNQGAYYGISF